MFLNAYAFFTPIIIDTVIPAAVATPNTETATINPVGDDSGGIYSSTLMFQ